MSKIRKAVIPAAGLGTRFLPATKAQPKEMLPIVDKPTIQYIIEEAVASGIEEILIITGRNKRSIEDHFDKSVELELELESHNKKELLKIVKDVTNLANIHFIRQKEPRGLGHAIHCAKSFVGDEPFAVMLGDDVVDAEIPCLKQLINCYDEYKTSILGVQRVEKSQVSKYGIVKNLNIEKGVYKVKDLIEKPSVQESPSNIAILGRYILMPDIFDVLEKTKPGKGDEIQLTDALKNLLGHQAIYAYEFKGRRYDVGDKFGYLQATVEMALKREDLREPFMKYLIELSNSKAWKKLAEKNFTQVAATVDGPDKKDK
ncbi:UTP--glucose-1-phosphate uridylyltransferase GalU [Clostridium arbusti]|uniref:UTP--glucose-1-phosphate uridylyltransferase GalU n=1 Tax=Clostridium arbusti TaxID=1137848 RepID=UPI000288062A|nr:UTP--glucose-1-phosphate uridylyltransferase GalU [Clostridium arbusti]